MSNSVRITLIIRPVSTMLLSTTNARSGSCGVSCERRDLGQSLQEERCATSFRRSMSAACGNVETPYRNSRADLIPPGVHWQNIVQLHIERSRTKGYVNAALFGYARGERNFIRYTKCSRASCDVQRMYSRVPREPLVVSFRRSSVGAMANR